METLSQLILSLEQRLLDPSCRCDYEQMESLLADDFEEVSSQHNSVNKTEALKWLTQPEKDIHWEIKDFCLKSVSDDVVIAVYKVAKQDKAREIETYSLRSSTWRCSQTQQWQLVFHQKIQ